MPRCLKQCIPGCESITRKSDTELVARVVAKVGPVKAGFTGAVTLSDVNPPESYRISGQGQGGVAGFARGGATVKLTEQGRNSTLMDYDVDAQIGGKLAMLGSRLIDSTARSMAQQFFDRFVKIMSRPVLATAATAKRRPRRKKPPGKPDCYKKPPERSCPKRAAKKSRQEARYDPRTDKDSERVRRGSLDDFRGSGEHYCGGAARATTMRPSIAAADCAFGGDEARHVVGQQACVIGAEDHGRRLERRVAIAAAGQKIVGGQPVEPRRVKRLAVDCQLHHPVAGRPRDIGADCQA